VEVGSLVFHELLLSVDRTFIWTNTDVIHDEDAVFRHVVMIILIVFDTICPPIRHALLVLITICTANL
jgi:hypothetical protein